MKCAFAVYLLACCWLLWAGCSANGGTGIADTVVRAGLRVDKRVYKEELRWLLQATDTAAQSYAGSDLSEDTGELPDTQILEKLAAARAVLRTQLLQRAQDVGVAVDASWLERYAQSRKQGGLLQQDRTHSKRWRQRTIEDLKIRTYLAEHVMARVLVTDAQIQTYCQTQAKGVLGSKNTALLPKPLFELSHILVDSRIQAKRLWRLAGRSADRFAHLAQQFSSTPEAALGGYLGWTPLERLPKPLRKMMRGVRAYQVVGPVESRLGYHLLYVHRVDTKSKTSKAQCLRQARTVLRKRAYQKAYMQLFQQAVSLARVNQRYEKVPS